MRFRVRTETDSFYVIDTTRRTMVRVPSAEGVDLEGDFTLIPYDGINVSLGGPEIGQPLILTWKEGSKARVTSNVVEVVKLSDPA